MRDTVTGVSQPFVEGTHYTFSGNVSTGGTITTIGTPLASNFQIRAIRILPIAVRDQWVDFGVAYSYSANMGLHYDQAIAAWQRVTREPFPEFSDVSNPGRFGAWSMYRFVGDSNPRSASIIENTALVGASVTVT